MADCPRDCSRDIKPLAISQAALLTLLDYRDGRFFWRAKCKMMKPGDEAGCVGTSGYRRIKIAGRTYKRSRLVWLAVFGADSYPLFIDHINRDRTDDRPVNLRLVTHGENQRNRSWGASKERYVYHEEGFWRARVSTPSGRKSLGRFATEAEAIEVVRRWEASNG